ncbi:MAG: hypothetical protein WCF84_08730 [Anaerolineae bacterium]
MIILNRLVRLALWIGVLWSVRGTRRHSRVATTWVTHLVGNTLLLGLPEIYYSLAALFKLDRHTRRAPDSLVGTANEILREMVVDNPHYAGYVAPVAGAIIVAHPRINLYKSNWANRQLLGLGLDSIPHGMTAFTLTQMVFDFLASPAIARRFPQAWQHSTRISAGVLAAASLCYETGEFLIHLQELRLVKDDPSQMAMEWSFPDTLQDLFANTVGWLLAVVVHFS